RSQSCGKIPAGQRLACPGAICHNEECPVILSRTDSAMLRRLAPLSLLLIVAAGLAAPPGPPAPASYNVRIRYGIIAFRNERLKQYTEMLAAFKAAGFVRDKAEKVPEDEALEYKYTRMSGTVPAKGVAKLLRQRHVRT